MNARSASNLKKDRALTGEMRVPELESVKFRKGHIPYVQTLSSIEERCPEVLKISGGLYGSGRRAGFQRLRETASGVTRWRSLESIPVVLSLRRVRAR